MRKILLAIVAVSAAFWLGGCIILNEEYQYAYDLYSVGVDVAPEAEDTTSKIPSLAYTDTNITMAFVIGRKHINFALKNLTKKSIKLIWDDAILVQEGLSKGLFHAGIKYTDKNNPQPPTVIPPGGMLEDLFMPKENVRWNSAGQYSSWIEDDLFFVNDYNKPNIASAILAQKGSKFQLYVPLMINDKTTTYAFQFIIRDVYRAKPK